VRGWSIQDHEPADTDENKHCGGEEREVAHPGRKPAAAENQAAGDRERKAGQSQRAEASRIGRAGDVPGQYGRRLDEVRQVVAAVGHRFLGSGKGERQSEQRESLVGVAQPAIDPDEGQNREERASEKQK
jgi:hypothetical protein